MHLLWTLFFASIAALWVMQGTRALVGMRRLPRLPDVRPLPDPDCPSVSVLLAARDEAQTLPAALDTLLALDYPGYEIIAVDDRSQDQTGAILDERAAQNDRLKVVHLSELPAGWLGKPHALEKAYESSSGQWLLFTDADVHFAPDVVRRAMQVALERGWDHLTLIADMDLQGFWEKSAVSYFGVGFVLGTMPWLASDQKSRFYTGMGAFQLLRRSAYRTIGHHRRLAMEVLDDVKLGKLVKLEGFHSGLAVAGELLGVRWYSGVRQMIRGVTKNLFAGLGYSLPTVLVSLIGIATISIAPFLGLLWATGASRALAGAGVLAALTVHALLLSPTRISPLYALTHPLGAALFSYMLARSTVLTLWRGGVMWRNTFYPLEELRRRLV